MSLLDLHGENIFDLISNITNTVYTITSQNKKNNKNTKKNYVMWSIFPLRSFRLKMSESLKQFGFIVEGVLMVSICILQFIL